VWLPLALAAGAALVAALRAVGRRVWEREMQHARARFLGQREHLEAAFFDAAAASGKPRGLRWKNCEWEREVAFALERQTGQLTALVAVTVQFEAIAGSDMEGLPAVGNLRNASAVFFYDRGRWRTTGKAVFNLNPGEAIEHFKQQYERVPPD
jgi:hypothetical protein